MNRDGWQLPGDPVADLRAAYELALQPQDAPAVLTPGQLRMLLALGARVAPRRRHG